jgi:Mg/Co/Ni transporter MgtE
MRVLLLGVIGRSTTKARDVMVSPVITVKPSSSVKEVATTLLERRISAVPVVDDQGKLVGLISEGDLMHRSEAGTERQRSWWLLGWTGDETLAAEYVKAHARKVAQCKSPALVAASPLTVIEIRLRARWTSARLV